MAVSRACACKTALEQLEIMTGHDAVGNMSL